jgi:hypothetical protein
MRCSRSVIKNISIDNGIVNKQHLVLDRLKLIESIGYPMDDSTLSQLCSNKYKYTPCIDYIINKYDLPRYSDCMSLLINCMKNYTKYKKYTPNIEKKSYPLKILGKYSYLTVPFEHLQFVLKLAQMNNTDINLITCKLIKLDYIRGIMELIDKIDDTGKMYIMSYIVKKKYNVYGDDFTYMRRILCKFIDDEWSDNIKKYFLFNYDDICECITRVDWYDLVSDKILANNMTKMCILDTIKKISDKSGILLELEHLIFNVLNMQQGYVLMRNPYGKTMRDIIVNDSYYKLIDSIINNTEDISIKQNYINTTFQNDPIFILYKLYTDNTFIKYKQIAFNILIYFVVEYATSECASSQVKSMINEIITIYNMGARPSPYTWIIVSGSLYGAKHPVIKEFLRNLLTKYNKVFDFYTRSLDLFGDGVPVELVKYDHPVGFFDENEINLYMYNKIFGYYVPLEDEYTEEYQDELDILVDA